MRTVATRPNILFCLADDAGMHFGAYGCSWVKTPAFDRVAREGVLFEQAYTPNAKCAPSRACLLTGRNSWQLEDAANHMGAFPARFKTVFESLGAHGYWIGHTAKGWAPGNPGRVDGKPRQLTGPGFNGRLLAEPVSTMISPDDYTANFADFLEAKPSGRPFCFWFGCREPHRGYEVGEGINRGGKKLQDIEEVYPIWPDTEAVRSDLLDYGFEIEHFDRHVGGMLALLEQRGELENTLVVVTSDNGMPFPRIKGQEYYRSNRLPMAVMWPAGMAATSRRITDFVSFIDVAPTFLEAAGVSASESGMAPVTGRSLMPLLVSSRAGRIDPGRDHVLIGKERHDVGRPDDAGYPIRGIFKDHYLYLRNFEPARWPAGNPETGYLNCDGSPTKTEILNLRGDPGRGHFWEWSFGKRPAEELYDVAADPDCLRNLVEDPDCAELRVRLAGQLECELIEQGDPRVTGGPPLDGNPVALSEQRDFYRRFLAGETGVAGWINPGDVQSADD